MVRNRHRMAKIHDAVNEEKNRSAETDEK